MTRARRWAMGLAGVIAAASVPALVVVAHSQDATPGRADGVVAPSSVPTGSESVAALSVGTVPAASASTVAADAGSDATEIFRTTPARQEAALADRGRPPATTSQPIRWSGADLSVNVALAAISSAVVSITITNPNGFAVEGVEVGATADGTPCQLTADTPTSLQIGPSVVVAVPARSMAKVTATCDHPVGTSVALVSATATWDDSRLPGREAAASVSVDFPL